VAREEEEKHNVCCAAADRQNREDPGPPPLPGQVTEHRYRNQHSEECRRKHPPQVLCAALYAHFIAHRPQDVVAAQQAEKQSERPNLRYRFTLLRHIAGILPDNHGSTFGIQPAVNADPTGKVGFLSGPCNRFAAERNQRATQRRPAATRTRHSGGWEGCLTAAVNESLEGMAIVAAEFQFCAVAKKNLVLSVIQSSHLGNPFLIHDCRTMNADEAFGFQLSLYF
jgi:hypothetical protein